MLDSSDDVEVVGEAATGPGAEGLWLSYPDGPVTTRTTVSRRCCRNPFLGKPEAGSASARPDSADARDNHYQGRDQQTEHDGALGGPQVVSAEEEHGVEDRADDKSRKGALDDDHVAA